MYKEKKILALIPARGGSKGLPRKNIKFLNDKPMIAWSIEAAKKSRYVDKIIVSSDDEDINRISREYGADVPFFRPSELALDDTPTSEVILYTMNQLQKMEAISYDYILLLQPTSPLRMHTHINEAIECLIDQSEEFDSLISVTELEHPVYWNRIIGKDNKLMNYLEYDNVNKTSRQNFDKLYRLNGAIYLAKVESFIANKSFECQKSKAYIMDSKSSMDIDTIDDFKLAEYYMGVE